MVANTRAEPGPLQAPPTFPQVAPAAGRTSGPPSQNFGIPSQRPPPSRFNQTVGLAQQPQQQQQLPPMLNPLGYPQMQQPQMQPHGPQHGSNDFSFNETIGLQQPGQTSAPPNDPNDYGRAMSNPPQDYVPRSGPHPTGPSGDFIPRNSARQLPTVNRGGMPAYDNRTMTAQRYKRRPPMWVVAALSCSIALLIAGVVIAVISSTSSPSAPKGTAPSPTAGSVAGVSGTGAGPFSSARTAFNNLVNQPGSTLVPPGAPPSVVTAPQITGAAPVPTAPGTAAAPQPQPAAAQPAAAPPAAAQPVQPAVAAVAPAAAVPSPAAQPAAPQPVRPSPVAAAPAPAAPPKPTAAKPALGAITVVCMPKCDQIVDNGTSLGAGHIFNRPVPSGRHVLQLSAPNGARKNLVVEVAPEQTKEVRMSMDK